MKNYINQIFLLTLACIGLSHLEAMFVSQRAIQAATKMGVQRISRTALLIGQHSHIIPTVPTTSAQRHNYSVFSHFQDVYTSLQHGITKLKNIPLRTLALQNLRRQIPAWISKSQLEFGRSLEYVTFEHILAELEVLETQDFSNPLDALSDLPDLAFNLINVTAKHGTFDDQVNLMFLLLRKNVGPDTICTHWQSSKEPKFTGSLFLYAVEKLNFGAVEIMFKSKYRFNMPLEKRVELLLDIDRAIEFLQKELLKLSNEKNFIRFYVDVARKKGAGYKYDEITDQKIRELLNLLEPGLGRKNPFIGRKAYASPVDEYGNTTTENYAYFNPDGTINVDELFRQKTRESYYSSTDGKTSDDARDSSMRTEQKENKNLHDFYKLIKKSKNDPYKILGIKSTASVKKIKTQRLELIKKYHPDKYQDPADNKTATKITQAINVAYTEAINMVDDE